MPYKPIRPEDCLQYATGGIWDRVTDSLAGECRGQLGLYLNPRSMAARLDSEIERAFFVYWIMSAKISGFELMTSRPLEPLDLHAFFLEPHYAIGPYKADFLLGFSKKPDLKNCVVVECDGHDFHEKTKEQVARDKKRDRFIVANVGKVIRFSGSEIYRDVQGCVVESLEVLGTLIT